MLLKVFIKTWAIQELEYINYCNTLLHQSVTIHCNSLIEVFFWKHGKDFPPTTIFPFDSQGGFAFFSDRITQLYVQFMSQKMLDVCYQHIEIIEHIIKHVEIID